MRIRAQSDFWCGALFVALGATVMVLAQDYRMGTGARMGPGYFPTMLGGLLALLGLSLAVPALLRDGEGFPRLHFRPLLVILASILLFGATLQYLGFVAAVAALVLASSLADRDLKPVEALGVAAFMVTFCVGVFWWLLGMPLNLWPSF